MCSLESTAFSIPIVERALHFSSRPKHRRASWWLCAYCADFLAIDPCVEGNADKEQTQHRTNRLHEVNTQNKAAVNVYDAIIIGAGPAGVTAAYFMGKKGMMVALIDKKSFPRHKPCSDAFGASNIPQQLAFDRKHSHQH
jgi:hypothetical protein